VKDLKVDGDHQPVGHDNEITSVSVGHIRSLVGMFPAIVPIFAMAQGPKPLRHFLSGWRAPLDKRLGDDDGNPILRIKNALQLDVILEQVVRPDQIAGIVQQCSTAEIDWFSKRLSSIIRRAQRPQWQGGSAACYWNITGKRPTQPMGPLRRREFDKLFESQSEVGV